MKVLLVGKGGIALATHVSGIMHQQKNVVEFVENNIEAKNIVNSAFEPEPIIITRTHIDDFSVKLNDLPRNKFFDKPKNNFKKR